MLPFASRVLEPQALGLYATRNRLRSEVGKAGMRKWAELVGRSFAPNLERGGMRRTWLRGRENVHKRYLIHVAGSASLAIWWR